MQVVDRMTVDGAPCTREEESACLPASFGRSEDQRMKLVVPSFQHLVYLGSV